jgi:hypothetical protein
MDLPFTKPEHSTKYQESSLDLTAAGNLMIFCKEVTEMAATKTESEILISQRFFDPSERDKMVSGKRVLKKVSQFLKGKIYGSRVAITNTSDSEFEINVLTEIPQGAIPVDKLDYFKSTTLNLRALTTQIIEFSFYFPSIGEFSVYQASITQDTTLVGTADLGEYKTVKVDQKLTPVVDSDSIMDVLKTGSKADILNFFKTKNLCDPAVQLADIYFLLKDKDFYQQLLSILKARFFFDRVVYEFSIYHNDLETMVQLIKTDPKRYLAKMDYRYLKNSILEKNEFTIKEYHP